MPFCLHVFICDFFYVHPAQEEVMEFVNSIAHIVHTSVAMHGGAANKNIGDAFLLVSELS